MFGREQSEFKHIQEKEMTPEAIEELASANSIIEKYQSNPGSLIPALEEIQEKIGYLPNHIQQAVARGLGLPLSEVYGVVTFYSFFTMMPRGKHTIKCCLGTACYVRGGGGVLKQIEEKLEIHAGETTEDRCFSLETVRCLGACGLAPVVVVDDDTHRQMKPSKTSKILTQYE